MAVNLDGVFFSMRAELAVMVPAGTGALVNVASGAGLVGFAGLPAYVASKHGVVGLTKSAAIECAPRGVRVNCVCPGSARTPMLEGFMGGDPQSERAMAAGAPIGRLATPEVIAHAIVWLCTDDASYMVGHALAVDGGATIQERSRRPGLVEPPPSRRAGSAAPHTQPCANVPGGSRALRCPFLY